MCLLLSFTIKFVIVHFFFYSVEVQSKHRRCLFTSIEEWIIFTVKAFPSAICYKQLYVNSFNKDPLWRVTRLMLQTLSANLCLGQFVLKTVWLHFIYLHNSNALFLMSHSTFLLSNSCFFFSSCSTDSNPASEFFLLRKLSRAAFSMNNVQILMFLLLSNGNGKWAFSLALSCFGSCSMRWKQN